jgi:hypothetical protein
LRRYAKEYQCPLYKTSLRAGILSTTVGLCTVNAV